MVSAYSSYYPIYLPGSTGENHEKTLHKNYSTLLSTLKTTKISLQYAELYSDTMIYMSLTAQLAHTTETIQCVMGVGRGRNLLSAMTYLISNKKYNKGLRHNPETV
jgi:hypothetical protein